MLQIIKAGHARRLARENGGDGGGDGNGDTTQIDLIYTNQTYEDIIMKEDLDNIVKTDPRIRVHYILSQPPGSWDGGVGHVTLDMIKDRLPVPSAGTKIMLCGPPGMIDAMKVSLESLGYDKARTISKKDDQVFCF